MNRNIGSNAVPLRSAQWFADDGRNGFHHRSWLKAEGLPDDSFDGRPIIGICNSYSELTPCNSHLRRLADHVARGVWQAGGVPLEFPTMSIGETLVRPTSMLYRNLMSMDVEESIRSNPVDGVVLLSGCDKTTPAQLMGAASVDVPAIQLTGGPMLNGYFKGETIGSGTHVWKFSEEVRAGRMSRDDFRAAEGCMSRSNGHCMTMGTASTMACMSEALGMQPSGGAAVPAVDARRFALAHETGRRIIDLVANDVRPSHILTREAFENAIVVNAAIGGSTNAVIHLLAIAGRAGVDLVLDDFDRLSAGVPLLVDLMPSGTRLMEEFYYAGGLPAVMWELRDRLHQGVQTVGGPLEEALVLPRIDMPGAIGTLKEPFAEDSSIAVLRGSLAPGGAVLKRSAATRSLWRHRGPALVFDGVEDLHARLDDPDLPVTADHILVLRGVGPVGYPGMPEVGNFPLPRRLLELGVSDVVRISDGRMSGTGFGTAILHVSPESSIGGPLALVRDGDLIEVDVDERRLDLLVDDAEIERRAGELPPRDVSRESPRGWSRIYRDHVLQADEGADLDVLRGRSGDDPGGQPF